MPTTFIPRNYPVYSADGQRILGWGRIYTPTDTQGSHIWSKHQAGLQWGSDSVPEADDRTVDFSRPRIYVYEQLKEYMDLHGVPPPPFTSIATGGEGAMTSFAGVHLSTRQLEDLSMSTANTENSVKVEDGGNGYLRFSEDAINTTLRWSCKGFTLSQTPHGWMLYKGELEDVGLQIAPTSPADRLSAYEHLGDHLAQAPASLDLALQLVCNGGEVLLPGEVGIDLLCEPEGTILPPGMIPRRRQRLSLDVFASEYGSDSQTAEDPSHENVDPKIFLVGYSGGPPQSQSLAFTSPATSRSKALRFSTNTRIRLTAKDGTQSLLDRTRSGLSPANVFARFTCVLPTPSLDC